ncbi:MAG: hypothetical protein L0G87_06580 [Renibacterium salmoninarum]|nr:hypothetical protein [Renibacterium salmoninarum]
MIFAVVLGLLASFAFGYSIQRSPQAGQSPNVQQATGEFSGVGTRTVSQIQISAPDERSSLSALQTSIDSFNARATPLTGAAFDQAKSTMQAAGYVPRSGLKQDFSQAKIFDMGENVVVGRVQLNGSNLAALSSVMYRINADGKVVTSESAAGLLSEAQMRLAVWDGGELTRDNLVTKDNATGQSQITNASIQTVGMDWGKLNSCLNSLGINWAILAGLGIICGAACAVTAGAGCLICLSGASGFWGGSIGVCVQQAWS